MCQGLGKNFPRPPSSRQPPSMIAHGIGRPAGPHHLIRGPRFHSAFRAGEIASSAPIFLRIQKL